MTEIAVSSNAKRYGRVQIADEALAVIAGTAALEVEGVAGMAGNLPGDIAEAFGVRNLSRGIKVEVSDGNVKVTVNLLIKFGYKMRDVSEEAQKRVKNAIETMTGMNAPEININITGVQSAKEK